MMHEPTSSPQHAPSSKIGMHAPIPVSVVILTHNEEANIAGCLDSCAWCDDVHVLDSGSTDHTVALVQARPGVQIHHHPFESFGAQRNWAIDHIPTQYDWIFHLDADEQFTPSLVAELRELLTKGADADGFYVPHKLMLAGRWLRRSGGYPVYQMRLFHKKRMRFIDRGHGQREEEGRKIGRLRQAYLHHAFSKGIDAWIEKHNLYSRHEANAVEASDGERSSGWTSLLSVSAGKVARRRALKGLTGSFFLRPRMRWFWILVIQRGLLDGRVGLIYAHMVYLYESMIQLKIRMDRLQQRQVP